MTAFAPTTSPDWLALWLQDRGAQVCVVPDIDAVANAHSGGLLFLSAPMGAPVEVLRHLVRWLAVQGVAVVSPDLIDQFGDAAFRFQRVLFDAASAVLVAPAAGWHTSSRVWSDVLCALDCNIPIWILGAGE
ncbi:hypothetical protein [Phaeobacter sp. NW0010-22]|uniref:hypothetical protein n=1 Tax=Phaeobacter sp. NW0010-22 TaxID=3135907 RepID=UPI00310AC558